MHTRQHARTHLNSVIPPPLRVCIFFLFSLTNYYAQARAVRLQDHNRTSTTSTTMTTTIRRQPSPHAQPRRRQRTTTTSVDDNDNDDNGLTRLHVCFFSRFSLTNYYYKSSAHPHPPTPATTRPNIRTQDTTTRPYASILFIFRFVVSTNTKNWHRLPTHVTTSACMHAHCEDPTSACT